METLCNSWLKCFSVFHPRRLTPLWRRMGGRGRNPAGKRKMSDTRGGSGASLFISAETTSAQLEGRVTFDLCSDEKDPRPSEALMSQVDVIIEETLNAGGAPAGGAPRPRDGAESEVRQLFRCRPPLRCLWKVFPALMCICSPHQ